MQPLWGRCYRLHSLATWRNFPCIQRGFAQGVAQCDSLSNVGATDPHNSVSRKRVFGIAAHIDAGKTTTCEAILYASGALGRSRMGRVDTGDTALDFLPAERERGITISAACATLEWRQHRVFLVDSPGHLDFTFEVERALRVMDAVVVLVDAVAGVQAQTETVWRQADRANLPRLLVVNKMDRDGARLNEVIAEVQDRFNVRAPLVQFPVLDANGGFAGVIDLVSLQASDNAPEAMAALQDADVMGCVKRAREALIEAVADVDDNMMGHFIEEKPIPPDMLREALRNACAKRILVPVVCAAALKDVGVREVMDAAVDYLPAPSDRVPLKAKGENGSIDVQNTPDGPFVAQAFKVMHHEHKGRLVFLRAFSGSLEERKHGIWNCNKQVKERPSKWLQVLADEYREKDRIECGDVFAMVGLRHTETGDTVALKSPGTETPSLVLDGMQVPPALCSIALETDTPSAQRQLDDFLQKRQSEDPSLRTEHDENTGELVLYGVGELQLDDICDRARLELGIDVHSSRPRVAYRERVNRCHTVVEEYDETIGSARLTARMELTVAPRDDDASENLVIVHGDDVWSGEQRDALRDSVSAALSRGALFALRTIGISCEVRPLAGDNGCMSYSAPALRGCSTKAVRRALKEADPVVLEPIMDVRLMMPSGDASKIAQHLGHPVECRGIVESHTSLAHGTSQSMAQIEATVPLDGMLGWAKKFRSICKGRGDYSMDFKRYAVVPRALVERVKTRL